MLAKNLQTHVRVYCIQEFTLTDGLFPGNKDIVNEKNPKSILKVLSAMT